MFEISSSNKNLLFFNINLINKFFDEKISKELGMDRDEVLRLTQISGLIEMFQDKDFSMAWGPDLEQFEDEL